MDFMKYPPETRGLFPFVDWRRSLEWCAYAGGLTCKDAWCRADKCNQGPRSSRTVQTQNRQIVLRSKLRVPFFCWHWRVFPAKHLNTRFILDSSCPSSRSPEVVSKLLALLWEWSTSNIMATISLTGFTPWPQCKRWDCWPIRLLEYFQHYTHY